MCDGIVLLGCGGHALVVIDTLDVLGVKIQGYIAPQKSEKDKLCAFEHLGSDEVLEKLDLEAISLVNCLGSVRSTNLRRIVYQQAKSLGFRFINLIHPGAIISSSAHIGEGSQVMAGAIIQPYAVVGENSIVNTGVIVEHECKIGDHVHLSPGVVLSGGSSVGEGTHVGTGASIIQNIKIGTNVTIGAGAVVTHNIRDNDVVVGVPAHSIGSNDLLS
ncbi:acetyltransferase [Terasakiella sp.]|uniref:acetyltransferase n=1 Tax=Terasakiella sp. TaxID=2034861 RepID=UPI003AA9B396